MELGKIKTLRKERKMSQMELAKALDVSLMSIRLWENEAGKPNEENYQKLLEFFEILPFDEKPEGE